MGEAFLDYKKGGSGLNINGIIEDYYVYAGENVNAGDFVEFVNGVAGTENNGSNSAKQIFATGSKFTSYVKATYLGDNKVFLALRYSGDYYVYGLVLVVDGATITQGSALSLGLSTIYQFAVDRLSNNKVFVACGGKSGNNLVGMICTIDGTTITKGTTVTINSSSYTADKMSVKTLSEDKVFVAHSIDSSLRLYANICTVSGTTITAGTSIAIDTTTYAGLYIADNMPILPNGDIFIAHNYGNYYYLYGVVCSISGTTITPGTNTQLTTSYTSASISPVLLPDGKIFIAHNEGSGQNSTLWGLACSIDGKSITCGTDVQLNATKWSGTYVSAVLLNTDKVFIFHTYDTNLYLYGTTVSVDGLSVVMHGAQMLNAHLINDSGVGLSAVAVDATRALVVNSNDSDYYYYANVWSVDANTNRPTSNIYSTTYETQVRPATSLPCNGVASTSGEGGDSSGHKDIVSVYRMPYSVYNLIKNGDFSNGLEGWAIQQASYGISDIVEENGEKVLRVKATNTGQTAIIGVKQNLSSLNTQHMYYLCADIKFTAGGEGSESNTICGVNFNSFWLLGGKNVTSDWSFYSKLYSINSKYSYNDISIGIYVQSLNDIGYFKNVKFYDLTEIFGAGNEPTQEWCDANL